MVTIIDNKAIQADPSAYNNFMASKPEVKAPVVPATSPTPTYKPTNNKTPVYGESSAAVLALQKQLNSMGANLKLDSKYGPLTQAAYNKYMGEAAVTQKETQTKQEAANIKATDITTDSSIVSSSAPKRTEEAKIKSDLDRMNPVGVNETNLRKASDAYIKEIDAQLKQLESQREADVLGINANFDETKRQTEEAQKKETGSTTVGLARIGGYLGNSASSIGAMINLGVTHKNEILSLENKRNAALREANNAYNEKRFDFVKLKLQEAKDIEKEVQTRKDKFFEQTLDLQKARQSEDTYLRDKYKDELETLGTLGASEDGLELDPAKAKEIDDFYGVPGFTAQYLDVVSASAKAKSEKEALNNRKNLLALLKDIPAGQSVRFPDGTEYTGLGSAGDVSTTLQVNDAGIGHIVAYNKLTGQTSVTSVGAVGKSKGGGSGANSVAPEVKDNVVAMLQMRLEESKLNDSTYDPDTYLSERKLIKEEYPQLMPYIDSLFLNKANGFFNDEAIVRLRKKGIFVGDQALSNIQEVQESESDTAPME